MSDDRAIDHVIRAQARTIAADHGAFDLMLAVSKGRAQSGRRKRWLLAPAAVTAALVGGLAVTGALPAVADMIQHFAAQTGIFGDGLGPGGIASGKHYTEMDGSEWINLNSPDFVRYADREMPTYIMLPAGTDRARFASNVAHILHDGLPADRDSRMQLTGVRHAFETGGQCLWYNHWKHAAAIGDQAAAKVAAGQFLASATWPLTVATDGGGVVAHQNAIYRAANAGDWAKADAMQGVDCDSTYMQQLTR